MFALPIDATLLQSPYPVHRIWEVNQDDYGGDPVANLADGGVRLLIWRKGDSLRMDPLEEDAWDFLAYIGAGMPFGSVCGRLLEKRPQDVGVLLFAAIQHGWLSLSQ